MAVGLASFVQKTGSEQGGLNGFLNWERALASQDRSCGGQGGWWVARFVSPSCRLSDYAEFVLLPGSADCVAHRLVV